VLGAGELAVDPVLRDRVDLEVGPEVDDEDVGLSRGKGAGRGEGGSCKQAQEQAFHRPEAAFGIVDNA
jgi:hypothetical protein